MTSKIELLNRLKHIAEKMENLYKNAAKKQKEIKGGIKKLQKKLDKLI
jgi:hypothetical protein